MVGPSVLLLNTSSATKSVYKARLERMTASLPGASPPVLKNELTAVY